MSEDPDSWERVECVREQLEAAEDNNADKGTRESNSAGEVVENTKKALQAQNAQLEGIGFIDFTN